MLRRPGDRPAGTPPARTRWLLLALGAGGGLLVLVAREDITHICGSYAPRVWKAQDQRRSTVNRILAARFWCPLKVVGATVFDGGKLFAQV